MVRYSLIGLLLIGSASARAAVTNADGDPRAMGFNAIFDSSSNLLWMDLNYTLGRSYGSVVADANYSAWRVATNAEALTLFQNVGLKVNGPGATFGVQGPGLFLLQNWGGSVSNGIFNGTSGNQGNFATSGQTIRNGEYDFSFYFVAPGGSIGEVAASSVLPNTGYSHIGVALVRSIPEPSGLMLAAFAIACAISSSRSSASPRRRTRAERGRRRPCSLVP